MKKSIKIILIILILNMITMINIYAQVNLFEIKSMSKQDLQGLEIRTINSYLTELESLKRNTLDDPDYDPATQQSEVDLIDECITKLQNEKNRRIFGEEGYQNYKPNQTGDSTKLQTIGGKVLAIVRNVGVAISVIALTIIGVKYMLGSVEQKAEYKKTMIPLVIGIIMLVAGTTLVSFIYDVTNEGYTSSSDSSSDGITSNPSGGGSKLPTMDALN